MIIKCIDSGSKGNSYFIEENNKILALDAGVKWREVLIACGFQVSKITSCLVSHEHG